MKMIEMLTLRRNAALGKLSTLQRRAERLPPTASSVVTGALEELTTALEHLQVATDQLQTQAAELANARGALNEARDRLQEYFDVAPVPNVFTNDSGEIELANRAAAELLNVSAMRLAGRPLMLFVTQRERFTDALAALNDGATTIIEIAGTIRPRERRPTAVRIVGHRLVTDDRRCWFLIPSDPQSR